MSNGSADRMVVTIKTAVKKLVLSNLGPFNAALVQLAYVYHFRNMMGRKHLFKIIYRVPHKISNVVKYCLPKHIGAMRDDVRSVELIEV